MCCLLWTDQERHIKQLAHANKMTPLHWRDPACFGEIKWCHQYFIATTARHQADSFRKTFFFPCRIFQTAQETLVDFILLLIFVHRSSCIILMGTAVCLQEWQPSLWDKSGGGQHSITAFKSTPSCLRSSVQHMWTTTACPLKGHNHHFKLFRFLLLGDCFTGIHERFTPEWLWK